MKFAIKGYVLMSIILITSRSYGLSTSEDIRDIHDLCRYNRHVDDRYMEENSSFQLNIHSDAKSDGNDKLILRKHKNKCMLMFKVCSSCHMSVLIRHMDIPSCSAGCSCNHFEIQEPLSDYTSPKYCGNHSDEIMYFESKTKIVHFDFVQSVHKKFYVSLTFNVSSNVYLFTESVISHPKYIETPHFPANYPSDYSAEYHFQALHADGYVQLLFLDFQLSHWSYVEVSGHNGTKTEVFYGNMFRPPAVISHGPSLSVRFVANDQLPSHGFRALYVFSKKTGSSYLKVPSTNCGGTVEDGIGVFQLVVPHLRGEQLFDCIWLIMPPPLFNEQSRFISASVVEFKNIGPGSSIEFREGLTSKSNLHRIYMCENSTICSVGIANNEVTTASQIGLFVRFQGNIKKDSLVAISYHTFREANCTSEEFACSDGRCINLQLLCDKHNHCTDGIDEVDCTAYSNGTSSESPTELESLKKERVVLDGSSQLLAFAVIGTCGILTVTCIILKAAYHEHRGRSRMQAQHRRENVANVAQPHLLEALDRYHLPPRDYPPSYEHVITFSERYPPLFYTRPAYQVETCMSEEMCTSGTSECDKNSLVVSDWDVCSSRTLHKINDSFVINVSTNSQEVQSVDVMFLAKKLKKSLSLDSAMNKLHDPSETSISNCSVAFKTSGRPYSLSAPCNCYFIVPNLVCKHNKQTDFNLENALCENTANTRSYKCSLVTNFPGFGSDIILSLKNNSLRKKAYSF